MKAQRVSKGRSILSLTSALDSGEGIEVTFRALHPRERDPVPIFDVILTVHRR